LRDWAGLQNHGVLTNGPVWTTNTGRQAISGDGSDDHIACGQMPSINGISQLTMSGWVKKNAAITRGAYFEKYLNPSSWIITQFWNDGNMYVVISSSGAFASFAYPTGTAWVHYCVVFDGSVSGNANRLKVYVDGVSRTLGFVGTIPAVTANNAANAIIMRDSENAMHINGLVGDVLIYNRALPANEAKLLAQRQGIAYELAPRRFISLPSPSFSAAWARRQSIIIGGGLH